MKEEAEGAFLGRFGEEMGEIENWTNSKIDK
jgi:hypothetical protein